MGLFDPDLPSALARSLIEGLDVIDLRVVCGVALAIAEIGVYAFVGPSLLLMQVAVLVALVAISIPLLLWRHADDRRRDESWLQWYVKWAWHDLEPGNPEHDYSINSRR